jgi:formate dehydrogenase subunit beta
LKEAPAANPVHKKKIAAEEIMATTAKIDIQDNNLMDAFEHLARSILETEGIGAILVPQRLPMKAMVMPVLVSDPEKLKGIDPLAPAFALNAAKVVSKLTRKPTSEKIAVMLRPCEIRAFVELVKLHQGRRDEVLIVGSDCLGAYTNKAYLAFAEACGESSSAKFCESALSGQTGPVDGIDLAPACSACEHFLPDGADLAVSLLGENMSSHLPVRALTPAGEDLLNRLDLAGSKVSPTRESTVEKVMAQRLAARDQMFAATAEAVNSLEKLSGYLANCVNCYNCRVACPVCYCRECVFVTDVFEHDPMQYLGWAKRKGAIKMPTDTTFYHVTRLAHMSTACVGCGQCSNACPNDVPVMELFRTVSAHTQAAFDYQPGRHVDDKPPLAEFREDEFQDVVGIE